MKIAILGAGRVGSSLARNLSNNNYEVSIVDEDKDKIDVLQEKLDIGCVVGHAAHQDSFKKLGIDEDTIVIAVTSNDEVNIIACQIAKKQFSAKKTICRFKDSEYINNLSIFGDNIIDIPISPEYEVTSHLRELIAHPGANQIEEFADGKVKLVSVKAKKQGELVGRELKNIKDDMPDIEAYIPMIYRKNKPFIPNGDTVIKENDEVYFVSGSDSVDRIVDEFRHEDASSRIMIVGGGKIGFSLARELENDYKVKLIDSNEAKCERLSRSLDKTIVLKGSATDDDLLKSENIDSIDVFCALTNDDETNVMSSLLAKKLGARKTMIILNNPSYLKLVPGLIDTYIAPYRLTVSSVLQDLRESDVAQDVMLKMDSGAEAIEGIVHANEHTSHLFGKSIDDIPMPEGASIAAIVRHGDVIMPSKSVKLALNDHLIFFLEDKNLMEEIEKFFKES